MKYEKELKKLYKQYKKQPILQKITESMKSKFNDLVVELTNKKIKPVLERFSCYMEKINPKPIESFEVSFCNCPILPEKLWNLFKEKFDKKNHLDFSYLKGNKTIGFNVHLIKPISLKCIYCDDEIKITQLGILTDKKFQYCEKCFKLYCCNQDLNYAQDCEHLKRNMLCDYYLNSPNGKMNGCPNSFNIEEMYDNMYDNEIPFYEH